MIGWRRRAVNCISDITTSLWPSRPGAKLAVFKEYFNMGATFALLPVMRKKYER
jgi:hypothetical protein